MRAQLWVKGNRGRNGLVYDRDTSIKIRVYGGEREKLWNGKS